MKKITKRDITQCATFLRRIDNLQSDIYNFASSLEDRGFEDVQQFASNSGFELDTCRIEMESCTSLIQSLHYKQIP